MNYLNATIFSFSLFLGAYSSLAQKTDNIPLKTDKVSLYDVIVKTESYKGKDALVVEQPKVINGVKTFAVLKDIDFHNGTIEVTLSGQVGNKTVEGARGFVGIAFRVSHDTSQFEQFYIRPTNGRANDQVRRNHSTQYVSYPSFPWERLRKEFPEKYESYADLVPAEWTKIKIVVKEEAAQLYVNGAEQPTLIVNDLKQGKDLRGSIGLWVGPGTLGHFTDLKITKWD
jgi:hypothetical protein